jgi:hypothetical protein
LTVRPKPLIILKSKDEGKEENKDPNEGTENAEDS